MASEWFYSQGTESTGPIATNALVQLAKNGVITRSTLVWKSGMKGWVSASNVAGLFNASELPPPPASETIEPPPLPKVIVPPSSPEPQEQSNPTVRKSADGDLEPISAMEAAMELAAIQQDSAEEDSALLSIRHDANRATVGSSISTDTTPGQNMKFWYCETCGKRLTEKDLKDGSARNKKLKGLFCQSCSVGVVTVEMNAINIARSVKTGETPSKPDPIEDQTGYPTGKATGIIRPQEVSRQDSRDKFSPGIKKKNIRALVAIGTIVVVVIVTAIILRYHAEPAKVTVTPAVDQTIPSPPHGAAPATPIAIAKTGAAEHPGIATTGANFQYSLDGTSEATRRILPTIDDLKKLAEGKKNGDRVDIAADVLYRKLQQDDQEFWTVQDYRLRVAACSQIGSITGHYYFHGNLGTMVSCYINYEQVMAPVFVASAGNPEQFLERLRAVTLAKVRPVLHDFLKKNYSDSSTKIAFCDWLKGNQIADPELDDYRAALLDDGAKAGLKLDPKVLSADEARSQIEITTSRLMPTKIEISLISELCDKGDGSQAAKLCDEISRRLQSHPTRWTDDDFKMRLEGEVTIKRIYQKKTGNSGAVRLFEVWDTYVLASKTPQIFAERLTALAPLKQMTDGAYLYLDEPRLLKNVLQNYIDKNKVAYPDVAATRNFLLWLKSNGGPGTVIDDLIRPLEAGMPAPHAMQEPPRIDSTPAISAKVVEPVKELLKDSIPVEKTQSDSPVASSNARNPKESSPDPRTPIPSDEKLRAAEASIRDIFKDDLKKTAPQDQIALAANFFQQAKGTTDDPAARYKLLDMAVGLSARNGDIVGAMNAIQQLLDGYQVEAGKLKLSALNEIARASKTKEQFLALAQAYIAVGDSAVNDDDYAAAATAYSAAQIHSRTAQDVPLFTAIDRMIKGVNSRRAAFEIAKLDKLKLLKNPEDQDGNLSLGKYLCFYRGVWETGLPLISKGSDQNLSAIAQADVLAPTDSQKRVSIGDRWWDYAVGQPKESEMAIKRRAVFWYDKAVPNLAGITRARVEKRIQEVRPQVTADELIGQYDRDKNTEFYIFYPNNKFGMGYHPEFKEFGEPWEFNFDTQIVKVCWRHVTKTFKVVRKAGHIEFQSDRQLHSLEGAVDRAFDEHFVKVTDSTEYPRPKP